MMSNICVRILYPNTRDTLVEFYADEDQEVRHYEFQKRSSYIVEL